MAVRRQSYPAWFARPGFPSLRIVQSWVGKVASRGADAMDKDIARLNIEHFRKLLERETDEAKREMLLRLLAEEEARLRALDHPERERRRAV